MTLEAYIPVNVIEAFVMDVFCGLGVPEADARVCADVLIASDLRGINSHGVGRLKYYYDRIQAGVQSVKTEIEIVKETETTAVVDGQHGMGHVIAYRSMRIAIEKAKTSGLGAVAVRNGTHFGIAGYYPLMAVQEGMMGLTVTNARPAIAPTFSTEAMLGTNPIAFAAPSDMPFPFCFDGATSIAQRGKIEVLARAGKAVPDGWVIGVDEKPVNDPHQVLRDLGQGTAALLPLGGAGELFAGYKGYGLATIVEILSASLCGGRFMKDLLGFAEDGSRRPYMLGHFFLASDIEHFIPLEVSRRITGQIMHALQQASKAPGQQHIFVAGEKEYETTKIVRARGIPVDCSLFKELQVMRDDLDISGYTDYL